MSKPRLLDLFCGAGGAAMGYHRAGFEVVGVDINPQPHYPFEFVQGDAIEYLSETLAEGFDHVHASPPCQAYSIMRNLPWLKGREYWDSVPPTRAALEATGKPWTLENVQGAPVDGVTLCGQMFGLRWEDGRPIYRHRRFESTVFMLAPGHPRHRGVISPGPNLGGRAHAGSGNGRMVVNGRSRVAPNAIGIDWMTGTERSQAIPPAYTTWIGEQLMRVLRPDVDDPHDGSSPERTPDTSASPDPETGSAPSTGAPVGSGSFGRSLPSGSVEIVACSPELSRGRDAAA